MSQSEAGPVMPPIASADPVESERVPWSTVLSWGAPVVGLSGLHAGCIEVFANDRVPALRDLKGKKVAILRKGGP